MNKKVSKPKINSRTKPAALFRIADCKKCGYCCTRSAGILLFDEIKTISKHLKISQKEFIQKYLETITRFNTTLYKIKQEQYDELPQGRCLFYDKETRLCKIHDVKPMYCRISTCKEHGADVMTWFDFNFFVNKNDPQSIREWGEYLEFGNKIPGVELRNLIANPFKLKAILNYGDLKFKKSGDRRRVKRK